METTYVYLHHQGFDFFLKDRMLTEEERYCIHCNEYDTLMGIYADELALKEVLNKLFDDGYALLSSDNYEEILLKYAPKEVFEKYKYSMKYLESRDEE